MFFRKQIVVLASLLSLCSAAALPAFSAQAPTKSAGFTDIAGVDNQSQIEDLVRLGVLAPASGKFYPDSPITRAEFIAWLVRANDVMRPDKNIKLASSGAAATFPDMPNSNPYFRYVQGMANAGWSVGYEDGTFKPAKALTREEMIAIKTPIDFGRDLQNDDRASIKSWSDYQRIGKKFYGPMSVESSWDTNWSRCFGKTKSAMPQSAVTRAEAAACVWQVGMSDWAVNPRTIKR